MAVKRCNTSSDKSCQCYLKSVDALSSLAHHFLMAKRRISELQAFGQVMRSHRLALGISQEDLAARAGLHRTYIGGVERGERNVSLRNIYLIANALETTAGELLSHVDNLSQ
jgi:DNA-binding XRE family transcriptional regulator